ncbi:MAG: DUF1801 domain-containing protein [Devosia sp.]
MADQKTKPHTGEVETFLGQVESEWKRADSHVLIEMMSGISGEPPVLWGTMVGFGQYHYKYPTGHEGDSFLVGFAPRKAAFSIYLMGTFTPEDEARREALLAKLGKHRMGKACLYVNKLSDIDLDVLHELVEISVRRMRATYPTE